MARSIVARRALWFAPVALMLAACSDMGSSRPVSLSVTTRSTSAGSQPVAGDIVIGSGPNSITISKVQVVLSEIELSPGGPCSTTTEDDGCDELETGPVLVDLPVDGTTKVVLDGLVPPGTYAGLEAKLDAVTANDEEKGASVFLNMHPEFTGISVMVTGTFTDASNQTHSFTFTSEADAGIEAAFQPPVTVDATTSNLTINVDVASWFKDQSGAVIDPTNTANAGAIEQNIQRSFHAFEDDNHDGESDDPDQGGGDH